MLNRTVCYFIARSFYLLIGWLIAQAQYHSICTSYCTIMDQDLVLRTPTTASPLKIQAYYHMLGLSSDSTREEVKAKCEALASMAATGSGASESSVNQRLVST